jgi:hypothetical protein
MTDTNTYEAGYEAEKESTIPTVKDDMALKLENEAERRLAVKRANAGSKPLAGVEKYEGALQARVDAAEDGIVKEAITEPIKPEWAPHDPTVKPQE